MAKQVIHACVSATLGGTPILGVTHFGYNIAQSNSRDPGDAAAPGPVEVITTSEDLQVQLFSQDDMALVGILKTAGILVITYIGAAGAMRTRTFKLVRFNTGPTNVDFRQKDANSDIPDFQINGACEWLATDTLALMMVDAAVA